MKLTITTPLGPKDPPVTIEEIVEKLNKITEPTGSAKGDFFKLRKAGSCIYIGSCSHSSIHNKLFMLLGLWLDSHYKKWATYTSFEDGVKFYYTINMLEDFWKFVDSIGSYENLRDTTINFDLQ